MILSRKYLSLFGAVGLALASFAAPAFADGEEGSMKDAPAEEGRKLTISFTAAAVSEYVFRGISQTAEDPTLQGSVDASYGIFYAGVWASGLDFGAGEFFSPPFVFGEDAQIEVDVYGGIKPTYDKLTFDFGVIYYIYPSASDSAAELDYVEFKAGVSGSFIDKLTTSTALYVSPDYTAEVGTTYLSESTVAYELPKVWVFTPTISGQYGYLYGEDAEFEAFFGDDNYSYWNAGLSLAVEKFTFDFRYWDTDLYRNPTVCANAGATDLFSCDERFVFTAKITLP